MILWLILVVLLVILGIRYATKRHQNFPPGPRGLPLIGSSLSLIKKGKQMHETMADLGKQYGPLVGMYMGNFPSILVSGYEAVKQCVMTDSFNGRPKFFTLNSRDERLGIMLVDGDLWKEQRRFMLWHLRDYGFGKGQMESIIHQEVSDLLQDMETSEGLVSVTDLFGVSVINVLWAMMAGKRYPHGDKELTRLLKIVDDMFRIPVSTSNQIWQAFPRLRKLFPNVSGFALEKGRQIAMETFIEDTIAAHKETFDENCMRDYIDAYLKEMQQAPPGSSFTERQLVVSCMDMFMAGSETTSSFLGFSLLYMIRYPDVQRKVQAELDSVVGQSRLPSQKDRSELVYTEATLLELFRLASIAPVSLPHSAMADTEFMGYSIPKDTFLSVNFWSLHMDKEHWGDPEVFRPERFIKDGKVERDDWLMPFGGGKRACAGESLARGTSFLFFTAVMQRFTLEVPQGQPPPDLTPLGGMTLAPKPYSFKATLRM